MNIKIQRNKVRGEFVHGNGIHDRFDGSILVGEYNCLNSLIHPKKVFDQLYERIRKSISRGNQVTLTVLDS